MPRFDAASARSLVDSVAQRNVGPNAIPGAVVAVVKDTSVVLAKGYGAADIASGRRADSRHTLFRIGSLTKLFTSTAALQLVEEGEVGLHTDVNRYFDGALVPPRFGHPVTLHHLLTHTPGFEDRFMGTTAYEASELKPLGAYLRQDLPERVRPPGQIASYSNHGIMLAGHLAATVADTAYADLGHHRIFSPLSMDRSAASLPALPDSLGSSVATPYHRIGDALVPYPPTYYQIAPAGSALVTAADMARFMIAHLNEGHAPNGRILQPETSRRMHRQQFTHAPSLAGWAYGFAEHPRDSPRILMHGGGARGFTALLWLVPEQDLGVFVVCNLPDASFQEALFDAFNERFLPSPDAMDFTITDSALPSGPRTVTGQYRHVRHAHSTVEKVLALTSYVSVAASDSGLVAEGLRLEPVRLTPLGGGRFRRSDGGTVVFDGVQNGTASTLFVDGPVAPAYERVSAWAAPTAQAGIAASLALVFLIAIVGAGLGWSRGRVDLARERRAAAGIGVLYLAFFVAFPLTFLEGPRGHMLAFFFGPSPELIATLALPLLALVASVYLALRIVRAWVTGVGAMWERVGLTCVVFASAACSLLLHYWNLLGWQF